MLKICVVALVGALSAAALSPAMAQTAQFKCAKPGTTVEYSDGGRTVWQSQEGDACRSITRQPNGTETVSIWYAPTLSARADAGTGYASQLKVGTLWPLAVGKKLTGRYDGPSGTAGYQGSWYNTVTIDGYEKVTTKAGTFDAFVVTKQEEAISHKFRSTLKSWYAPENGVTVKFTYTDSNGGNRAGEAVSIK